MCRIFVAFQRWSPFDFSFCKTQRKSTLKLKKMHKYKHFLSRSWQCYCSPIFMWTPEATFSLFYYNLLHILARFFQRLTLSALVKCLNIEKILKNIIAWSEIAHLTRLKLTKNDKILMKLTRILMKLIRIFCHRYVRMKWSSQKLNLSIP